MTREKCHVVRRRFLLSKRSRNERTNNSENDVPGGLLFGLRFRLGLPVSNSRLADCAAFRVARFPGFPFAFAFAFAFCTFFGAVAGGSDGVNEPCIEVDEPEVGLRLGVETVVNEGCVFI
jgi:hypothetical protein